MDVKVKLWCNTSSFGWVMIPFSYNGKDLVLFLLKCLYATTGVSNILLLNAREVINVQLLKLFD